MQNISLSYSTFKSIAAAKNLKIQYQEPNTIPASYDLFAFDGPIVYATSISASGDISDFETNYKASANGSLDTRDGFGNTTFSVSVFGHTENLYPKEEEYKYIAPPGVISIFDEEIDQQRRIAGGKYWITDDTIDNVHADDIVKFGVVDKNDVLGLFDDYGIPAPPSGILEFPKFVKKKYLKKGAKAHGYNDTVNLPENSANVVYTGLFTRTIVDRTSAVSGDITIIVGLKFYE